MIGRSLPDMGAAKTYDVTAREAAERLGVCPETVRRWARNKRSPAKKNMSGQWMFALDDLDRLPVGKVIDRGNGRR